MSYRNHHQGGNKRHRDWGRGYDRKRRRDSYENRGGRHLDPAAEVEARLDSLIIHVGDKSASSLDDNLNGLSTALQQDISRHSQRIISTLLNCIAELPTKTGIYATLLALVNLEERNAAFIDKFMSRFVSNLEDLLADSRWHNAALCTRFLAASVNTNLLSTETLTKVYSQYLNIVEDPSYSLPCRDTYAYMIMVSLPWAYVKPSPRNRSSLQDIFTRVEGYVRSRPPRPAALNVFSQTSMIDMVQALVEEFEVWQSTSCPPVSTIDKPSSPPWASFEARFATANDVGIGTIRLPENASDVQYIAQRVLPRFVDDSQMDLSHLLVRTILIDVMKTFKQHRKDAAKLLLQVIEQNGLTVNVLSDAIFGELLRLPTTDNRHIFYGSLILELCKVSHDFPPALGATIHLLYSKLDSMDIELLTRFSSWFAHHLSNTEYTWDWARWSNVHRTPRQEQFIREALSRSVRLSYLQRVQGSVPSELASFLPPEPQPSPLYDTTPGEGTLSLEAQLFSDCTSKIRARTPPEELLDFLSTSEVPETDRLRVFYGALLQCGHKTVSHMLVYLERYLSILRQTFVKDGDAQLKVLECVGEFWSKSPLMQVITIDRLMRYQVLDSNCILKWVFAQEKSFDRGHIWEILYNSIEKTLATGRTISRDLSVARQTLSDARQRGESSEQLESRVAAISKAHDTFQGQEKAMFLTIFQRFVLALDNHINGGEGSETSDWFTYTSARMLEVGRKYILNTYPFIDSLGELLFRPDSNRNVREVFEQIKEVSDYTIRKA